MPNAKAQLCREGAIRGLRARYDALRESGIKPALLKRLAPYARVLQHDVVSQEHDQENDLLKRLREQDE